MQRSVTLSVLTVLLFLTQSICSQIAFAATPVVHISPKPTWLSSYKPYDKRPSLRTVQNGYFFALIEQQIHIEKQASYFHTIREIVSEAGIQNGSQITVSFEPSFQRLDFHEIVVWRNNKPVNRLKASGFKVLADEKELSSFIYQGSYSALFILDDIRKGDRIEFSYTLTGSNPIFADHFSRMIYLQDYQPIAHQYFSLISSDKRKLNFKNFNKAPQAVITTANALKTYTWESFQVPAGRDATLQPGWYNDFMYVQATDFQSWAEVVDWASKINPAATDLKGALKDEVTHLKAISGGDKYQYFRNAVTAVQDEVRYMGIEIGQYSHRANDPSKVFAQRYGDCKDKSLLLVSLLRANGIDAWMALVNTAQAEHVDQFLPAYNLFDHAVVMAQIDGKPVWVDATMSYQRGTGANIYFPHYGKGLVLKPGTNGFTNVTAGKTGKIENNELYTITGEKDSVKLVVTTIYNLNQADYMRDRLASGSMAEIEKSYLDYYAGIYPKIDAADSVTVIDDEKANKITTIERYRIANFFKKDSLTGKYNAGFYANYINDQLPAVTGQIKTPVSVNFPNNIDQNISVIIPAGWNIKTRREEIKRDAYEFASKVTSEGDTLKLNYHFAYLQGFVPTNKLDEFRTDIKQISDEEISYNFSYTPDVNNIPFYLNLWLVALVVFLLLLSGCIAVLLYRRETPHLVFTFGSGFVSIGGWLILILIGLFITPVFNMASLLSEDYFNKLSWVKFDDTEQELQFKVLLITEVASKVLLSAYAIFCLVMFINRRDILPRYIIGYFIAIMVTTILNCVLSIGVVDDDVQNETATVIIRVIIMGGIWIRYFMVSQRVQETFIVPFPSNNYSYEHLNEAHKDQQSTI